MKYRYEFTDTLGMVTSFSYAGDKNRQLTRYSDTRWHEDSVRNRWFSVMAGPSVRVISGQSLALFLLCCRCIYLQHQTFYLNAIRCIFCNIRQRQRIQSQCQTVFYNLECRASHSIQFRCAADNVSQCQRGNAAL